MTSPNRVRIDIEVVENNQLGQLTRQAKEAGERIGRPLEAAAQSIDRAFGKTTASLANQLDKIEQEAWRSGKGMDDAFGAALGGLRRALDLTRTEAAETGATLHSSVGGSLNEIRKGADQLAASLKPVEQAAVKVNTAFDKTARLVGVELDRIERDAWSAGRGTDAAFQTALRSVRDDFERVRDVGRRTGASLESDMGQALRDVKREMDRLGDQAKETGREIEQALGGDAGGGFGDAFGDAMSGGFDAGGMIESLIGGAGVGGGAAAAGAAVGALVADQAMKALEQVMAERSIGGMIAAQNAGSLQAGLRLGRLVGDNFAEGFGDSIEDVGAAASSVISAGLVSMDAPRQAIDQLTEMAATAAKITGASAEEISQTVRVMLHNNMAGSAQEAFDMIVTGFQRGANAGGDFLAELSRGGVNLKQFGLSGEQAIGTMIQALNAGAPSADAFTGALEELVGNAVDGIPVFQKLGLGGQEFANALVGGGPKAARALDQLMEALRKVESPAERSAMMVSLFGEEAMVMGDALLAVDPSTAAKGMEDFAGATDKAAASLRATQDPMDMIQRQTTDFLTGPLDNLAEIVGGTERHIGKVNQQNKHFAETATEAAAAGAEYARSLQEIVSASADAAGQAISYEEAQIGLQEAIRAGNQALIDNGKNLEITTEEGSKNKKALLDIADATWKVVAGMEQQNKTTEEVHAFISGMRGTLIQMAIDMGMDAAAANDLANKLGLIPGNYVATTIVSGYEAAYARVESLEQKLAQLPSTKIINLRINTSGSGSGGHFFAGQESGGVTGYRPPMAAQTGGARNGPTTVNENAAGAGELIELPSGSRVMTAGATRAYAEAGLLGGGGGGPVEIVLSWAGTSDPVISGLMQGLRYTIMNQYGGSVTRALGQAGAA